MAIGQRQAEPAGARDDEVHDGPGHGETARLAREPADHLGPPAHLLERPFEQVGRAQTASETGGIAQVDREGGKIVGQTRRRRWEGACELADEDPQPMLGVVGSRRAIERRPVGRPGPSMEAGSLWELGQDVAQAMDVMPTSA